MKKSILNLKGSHELSKNEQKNIQGQAKTIKPSCYPSSDPACCGTAQGQCGVGPYAGGILRSGRCVCF